jgi:hypothetical protein
MTTESELDTLLAKPLEAVADDGFSRNVSAEIGRRTRLAIWFDWSAIFVTFLLIVLFVPLGRLAAPFEALGIGLSMSLPFAIACAALALSFAMTRAIAD